MDTLRAIRILVACVDHGSLTAAGRALGISAKQASKDLAALEAQLGQRLLYRTTRRLHPTPNGEQYLERCRRALGELDRAERDLQASDGQLRGVLRIAAPVNWGEIYLPAIIAEFADQHPQLRIELALDDHYGDLVRDGIDLALRIGRLDDSSLVAVTLHEYQTWLVASPSYLKQSGCPSTPAELGEHRLIYDSNQRGSHQPRWRLSGPDGEEWTTLDPSLEANSAHVVARLAAAGQGIALSPDFAARSHIKNGSLQRVMPAWHGPILPLQAVYPGRDAPSAVKLLIKTIREHRSLTADGPPQEP